jgi:hypothetical protein
MTTTVNAIHNPDNPPSHDRGLIAMYRKLYRPADTRGGGPRAPHPGDILYWAACLGAACLLLLAAT